MARPSRSRRRRASAVLAINQWDGVLIEEPRFAKAAGNRGQALELYAECLEDGGHVSALLGAAHASFRAATAPGSMHEADMERVVAHYEQHLSHIEAYIDGDAAQAMMAREFPLGGSPEEIAYRRWCLDERLTCFVKFDHQLFPQGVINPCSKIDSTLGRVKNWSIQPFGFLI